MKKILKAPRPSPKKVTYERTPIRLPADFSADMLQVRREWNDIFKILKQKLPTKNTLFSSYPSKMKEIIRLSPTNKS